jgi:hypothetical protein
MSLREMSDSFLRNCRLYPRDTVEVLFESYVDDSGRAIVVARLDGYTIVPNEIYESLSEARCTVPSSSV